jgi:hypothetical protein
MIVLLGSPEDHVLKRLGTKFSSSSIPYTFVTEASKVEISYEWTGSSVRGELRGTTGELLADFRRDSIVLVSSPKMSPFLVPLNSDQEYAAAERSAVWAAVLAEPEFITINRTRLTHLRFMNTYSRQRTIARALGISALEDWTCVGWQARKHLGTGALVQELASGAFIDDADRIDDHAHYALILPTPGDDYLICTLVGDWMGCYRPAAQPHLDLGHTLAQHLSQIVFRLNGIFSFDYAHFVFVEKDGSVYFSRVQTESPPRAAAMHYDLIAERIAAIAVRP